MSQRVQPLRPVEKARDTPEPFQAHRDAALALLNGNSRLSNKAGQFLGHIAVDSTSLSPPQASWLAILLQKAGLPELAEGSAS